MGEEQGDDVVEWDAEFVLGELCSFLHLEGCVLEVRFMDANHW